MRTIKFRAWDKKRKEWYRKSDPCGLTFYDFHVFGECTLIDSPRCEDLQYLVLQQFTGLKDKNGVEIYEGDIIRLDDVVCEVTFSDGSFQMITSENQGRSPALQIRTRKFMVIGNLYESPELLEDK